MEKTQTKRQEIARQYNEAFKDLPVYTQTDSPGLNHNYHKYTLRFKDKQTRDRVKNALRASVHYEKSLSINTMYNNIAYRKDDCVNSKLVSETILSLPIHAWLTEDEIKNIINTLRNELYA
jgi:dTDP-4-amino-4,6-dideoxygalactose transaminase